MLSQGFDGQFPSISVAILTSLTAQFDHFSEISTMLMCCHHSFVIRIIKKLVSYYRGIKINLQDHQKLN